MPEPILKPESDLEQLRAELEASENRVKRLHADFQEFVSRVSHDLREPLRTIASYTQLLASRKGGPPGEDDHLFVQYILDAVDRSQALLAAMIEFAGADPERRHPARVDMDSVFFEAVRRLKVPPDRLRRIRFPPSSAISTRWRK
jgi:light-regulated signal transduction histidine kinase (bacteriophytochrome)